MDSYPIVELDSDIEGNSSSEDDIDIFLHGTPEQRRRLRRRSLGKQSSSSEDEFEKEMSSELNATMKTIEGLRTISAPSSQCHSDNKEEDKFYDQEYFDSDSDEETSSKDKGTHKHPVLSNDELLYDPHMDDEDQSWVDQQRQSYQPQKAARQGTKRPTAKSQKLPHSDAVLNCPACMTQLCLDCQRHDVYRTQFRAMFVQNCTVDFSETLNFPKENSKSRKSKKKKRKQNVSDTSGAEGDTCQTSDESSLTGTARYHPVKCEICTTQVGVFDEDEVYHFFNILASYG